MSVIFLLSIPSVHAERYDKFIKKQQKAEGASRLNETTVDIIENPNPLSAQTQDFFIEISPWGSRKETNKTYQVEGVERCQIKKVGTDDNSSLYTIIYYIDGRPIEVFENKTLPFNLKRDCRGLSKGAHTLSIKLVDQNEKVGIRSIKIQVKKWLVTRKEIWIIS